MNLFGGGGFLRYLLWGRVDGSLSLGRFLFRGIYIGMEICTCFIGCTELIH